MHLLDVEVLVPRVAPFTGAWIETSPTSLDHRDHGKDAAYFAALIRDHWGIENQLHWCLDVAFAEDDCRVHLGHTAANLSRIALNLLK